MGNRVLIINNKSLKRRLIRYALATRGYEIVGEMRKGFEAVSLYNEFMPDLVAIDISMHQYYQGVIVIFLIDSKARNIILENSKHQDLQIKVLEPEDTGYAVTLPDEDEFLKAI